MADPPGCQQAPILKQSSSGTPKPPRGLFPMITTDEDPYGPMAGHFYTNTTSRNNSSSNAANQNQNAKIPNSQSVLTSPESRPPSCAYHSSKQNTHNISNHQILSGSSADLRHYHHQVQCSNIWIKCYFLEFWSFLKFFKGSEKLKNKQNI